MVYCTVLCCRNSNNNKNVSDGGVSYHRREAWIEACGRADLKTKTDQQLNNMRVCCLHFEKYMYVFGENQLIDVAVPTLRLPPSSAFSVYTQTEQLGENKMKMPQEFQAPGVKVKTEVTDTDTNVQCGMELPNDTEYSPKRIKVENDMDIGDCRISGGGIGMTQTDIWSPNVTVEQFLRGCELYLTPELRQYVKTQIILPH